MMEKCCGTCAYAGYDLEDGYYCGNEESTDYTDFVDYSYWCEEWEEKE